MRQIGETDAEIDLGDCEIVEEKKDEEQESEENEISEEEFESDEIDINYEKYERLEVYDESNDDEGYVNIEDEEINSIAIDSLETNENYLIERKFIDENGKVQRLKDFVIDLWKIDDAQIKNDDESEESDEVLKKSSKISNSSKNLLKIHTRSIRSAQNFQNSSTFIISDLPQNGKSTALKQIALEIRKHSPSTWVVYVNFKEFNLEEFDWKNSTVLDFLTQKSSKFDIEIFKLFAKQKKKFSKQNWIAANQNHVKILKEKFRVKVLKFAEIDQNDVQQFLEYFDESHEENLMKLIEEISVSHLGTIKEIAEAVEELDDTLNIYKISHQ
ncbi:hypothetical protein PVAND_016858 [Polypedilum vanderplanki]|uniref:Uncharacterized protein n=1 Tax=Polypedilum vanderplanki TaxID=319348 RepID=A0A9J6BH14_POLVA|nr:hypothetical protein PVAND_016858 [Polypedilum vanderplanki]